MAECYFCNQKEGKLKLELIHGKLGLTQSMLYKCHHCGKTFCHEHRLPPNHNCPNIEKWKKHRGPGYHVIHTDGKKLRSWKAGGEPARPYLEEKYYHQTLPKSTEKSSECKFHKTTKVIGKILKVITALAVIIVIGLLIWAVLIPWIAGTFVTGPSINISQLENETFNLVNQERIANGLPPVMWNEQVAEVAELHSKNMAESNFFAHQDPQGKNVGDRLHDGGIVFYTCGEILLEQSRIKSTIFIISIYKTQSDLAQDAVSGWMSSSGHREIILTSYLTEAGVGVWASPDGNTYYFTGDFIG